MQVFFWLQICQKKCQNIPNLLYQQEVTFLHAIVRVTAIKTLGEVLNATKLTETIKKRVESIVSNVYQCLNLFVVQLNKFQSDIEIIKVHIDGFKNDAASLDDESVEGTASTNSIRRYVKIVLQKMYEDFHLLKGDIVDNNYSNLEK